MPPPIPPPTGMRATMFTDVVGADADLSRHWLALKVELRQRPGDHEWWSIMQGSNVYTREGTWEWEPQPSSRDDAFLERARWRWSEIEAALVGARATCAR